MTAEGIAAMLVAAVGAAGGLYAAWRKTGSEVKLKEQATALSEAFVIVDRLETQNGRQQQQIDAKQGAIDRLFAMHAACEAGQASQYAWMQEADRWMRRHSSGAGDEPPPLPPPPRPGRPEAEYTARTAAMNAGLSGELSRTASADAEAVKSRIIDAGGQP